MYTCICTILGSLPLRIILTKDSYSSSALSRSSLLFSLPSLTLKPSDIQLYLGSMPTSTLVGSPPCKLLWEVTTKHDFPHTLFLAHPETSCLVCSSKLKTHNYPTAVICYTLEGSLPAAKITLCCTNCHLNYRYDQFGNSDGYQYYQGHIRPFDARCKAVYTPDLIKEEHPTYNTMSCEQTFVWLSRFKKVVCAMHKTHHHFYIRRMVKRRNSYIEYCYMNNRRPLQPKAKSSLVQYM